MEKEIMKVVLDWKAPSEKKIADFMEQFDVDKMIAFANACVDENDKFNRSKAKAWLVKEFDKTDYIEWKNRPETKEKKLSGAKRIAAWKNLKK